MHAVAISPDGRFLFVAGRVVGAFARDLTTGALTPVIGIGGCVSADGKDVDGAAAACTTFAPVEGASGLAVSPDGKFLYVGSYNFGAGGVSVLSIASDGALGLLPAPGGCFKTTADATCSAALHDQGHRLPVGHRLGLLRLRRADEAGPGRVRRPRQHHRVQPPARRAHRVHQQQCPRGLRQPRQHIKGWAAYEWAGKASHFGFGGCDNIADYSLVPALAGLARVRAHASAVRLRVPAGVDWANLELRSADGIAQAKIEGPGGVSFATPEKAGLTGGRGDKTMALADAASHRTVIGIRAPKPGVYTVTSIGGAPRIVDAHVAYGRPTTVKARVTGKGAERVLHHRVTGQKANVVFEERAAKADNTLTSRIGTARRSKDTIPFRSADLGPTRHIVVAQVTKGGQELPAETVARFVASPAKPVAPKRLRIKVNQPKAFATVTWAKDKLAARYDVKLRTTSGRRMELSVRKPKLTIPSVYAGDRITVTVRAVAPLQRKGAARTATVKVKKAAKPKPKSKPKKTKKSRPKR